MFLRSYIILNVLLFLANTSYGNSICLSDTDATLRSCIQHENHEFSQKCQEKYGQEFNAFYLSNNCTVEVSIESTMDESIADTFLLSDDSTPAVCLTYEQGQKNKCEYWDYNNAFQYCSENYGENYLPYISSNICNIELADKLYGYVDSEKLIDGLEVDMTQAEAMMQIIDREGLNSSLGGLVSLKPAVGNEFYTDVMKNLLLKLELFSKKLSKRSALKVKLEGKNVKNFVAFSIRYLQLINRIYKVYAYVAHRNHYSLKSYSFNNLDFLNLKIKKKFALEIIAEVQLKVRNLDNDYVEFLQSEQNKNVFEYVAIAEPHTKVDYGKLVTFMGVRENLNNLWAINRVSRENLLNTKVNKCSEFLSYRKSNGSMSLEDNLTIRENIDYDLFYNGYVKKIASIAVYTTSTSIISDPVEMTKIINHLKEDNSVFREYIARNAIQLNSSEDEVIDKMISILKLSEDKDWYSFSANHFATIVFPGDKIRDVNYITDLISQTAYERRLKAITNTMMGLIIYIDDETQREIKEKLLNLVNKKLKEKFKITLSQNLVEPLEDYTDRSLRVQNNQKALRDGSLKIIKKAARAANALALIEKGLDNPKPYLPATYQELVTLFEHKMSDGFVDIKLALSENPEYGKRIEEFLKKVAEKFNGEYLVEDENLELNHIGTFEEREQKLYEALIFVANEYYLENEFEISNMALVPEAALIANEKEREKITKSPYTLQIYRDGTPVTVNLDDFYAAFAADLNLDLPKSVYLLGIRPYQDLGTREIKDSITDGTFDRPRNYITAKGEIKNKRIKQNLDMNSLYRIFKNSLDMSKHEMNDNLVLKLEKENMERENKYEMYEDVERIKDSKNLFARFFELFNIPMTSIMTKNQFSSFKLSRNDQKILAESEVTQAYATAPLLRVELTTKELVKKTELNSLYIGMGSMYYAQNPNNYTISEVEKDISRSLLLKIGLHAFDNESQELDEEKAVIFFNRTLDNIKKNIKGKFQEFCDANYLNYKHDEKFKKSFNAAKFLRQSLMTPVGTTLSNAKAIRKFDERISKEIRSWYRAFQEDVVDKALFWLGIAAIVAVGVLFAVGTWGIGTAGSAAMLTGYLGLFLSFEFYISLVLVSASLSVRINSQFFVLPEQFKYQQSLAQSQIESNKLANHDEIEKAIKANKKSRIYTLAFAPLDVFYGYQVARHIRGKMGYHGVNALKKLTGVKVRKYSSPPRALKIDRTYQELRSNHGIVKATALKLQDTVANLKTHLPKYQVIPEELIRTKALRVGLARKFKDLGIKNKPWKVLDDVKDITQRYKDRLQTYTKYVAEEGKFVEALFLKKGLTAGEIVEYGTKNSKFGFNLRFFYKDVAKAFTKHAPGENRHIKQTFQAKMSKYGFRIKSFFKALKERRLRDYLQEFGDEYQLIQEAQAQFVKNKLDKFEKLINKIDDFKVLKQANSASDSRLTEDFFKMLSDDDIFLLQSVARNKNGFKEFFTGRQEGIVRELRDVFNQYDKLVEGIRPITYLYGHTGEYMSEAKETADFLFDSNPFKYTVESDAQDLVQYYETMIKHHSFNDKASLEIRKRVEEQIAKLFYVDSNGKRVYY